MTQEEKEGGEREGEAMEVEQQSKGTPEKANEDGNGGGAEGKDKEGGEGGGGAKPSSDSFAMPAPPSAVAMPPPPLPPSKKPMPPPPQAPAAPPQPTPASYKKPVWSGAPSKEDFPFMIEILKNGTIMESVDIGGKELVLIGRNAETCDIVLEHPSISRQHAAIQFKADGGAYLYDMSTHGSRVNKKQLKSKVYAKLHVGDVLHLGQSSRLLIFSGPEEMVEAVDGGWGTKQRVAKEKLDAKVAAIQAGTPPTSAPIKLMLKPKEEEGAHAYFKAREEGPSWGFGDDAEEEEEDESEAGEALTEARRLRDAGKLTEKQSVVVEKYEKKVSKIANLRDEMKKIRKKEEGGDELTPGQMNQIKRCEERAKEIEAGMLPQEEALTEMIRQIKGLPPAGAAGDKKRKREEGGGAEEVDSDDDDFYDRTDAKAKAAEKKKAPQTLKSLRERKDAINVELGELELCARKQEAELARADDSAPNDSLEDYMKDIKLKERKKALAVTKQKLKALGEELTKVQKLIAVVMPALAPLSSTSVSASSAIAKAAKQAQLSKQAAALKAATAPPPSSTPLFPAHLSALAEASSLPPPSSSSSSSITTTTAAAEQTASASASAPSSAAAPHPPKEEEEGAVQASAQSSSSSSSSDPPPPAAAPPAFKAPLPGAPPPPLARQPAGPAKPPPPSSHDGTAKPKPVVPAFIDEARGGLHRPDKKPKLQPPPGGGGGEEVRPKVQESWEEEEVVWKPPSGQTGDGKTSLNAKLGY